MKKKILGIFISLLMLATCIGPTIFTENELNVKATTPTEGNVGLDYDTIYENLETLSYVVFNDSLEDYGIHKGRDFGTEGDRWAANKIVEWMGNFSVNLTGSEVHKEPIGYYNDKDDYFSPKKADILGFSLQLKNGTDDPITISTNESYPLIPFSLGKETIWSVDFTKIVNYTSEIDDPQPPDQYNYLTFSVIYTKIQDVENFSDMGLDDELVYVENYSNASAEDIEGRVHLLNVSDNELNDTLTLIANANATGFILIRDDVSDLQGWELPLPGVAVSEENGSLIQSYIQNESFVNVSAMTPIDPFPVQGNLEIYYYNSSTLGQDLIIYLVNNDIKWKNLTKNMRNLSVVGALCYSLENKYGEIHEIQVPNYGESLFFRVAQGFRLGMWQQIHSYSSWLSRTKPAFSINRTIYTQDGPKEIHKWIEENPDNIKASFWLNWRKNDSVESYNVYCTVPGKNQSKTVIISGGHYDGLWGQMSTDDAAGVAIMLGVLKYMNDHHITPKYNLIFITFSGEEYIDKGSRGYVLRHWDEINSTNIKCILNLDVIAHDINGSNLYIHTYDRLQLFNTLLINSIVTEIAEGTNYYERNNHNYSLVTAMPWKRPKPEIPIEEKYPVTDAFPFWLRWITAINFGKEPFHEIGHRTGRNHTKGDVMTHIDPTDLEVSTDLFWNVSKFFCVDPDCHFEDITYTYSDDNDINSENDTVNVSFTIKTVLPQEKATVKLILIPTYLSNPLNPAYPILYRYRAEKEFIVTPEGTNGYITLQLPKGAPKATYRANLILLNSTGDTFIDAINSVSEKFSDIFDFSKDKMNINCTEKLIQCADEISTDFYLNIEKLLERDIDDDAVHDLIIDLLTLHIFNNDKETDLVELSPPNDPPEKPKQPEGPQWVHARQEYNYTTSTTDPNQDHIEYKWRFHLGDLFKYNKWSKPCDSGEDHTQSNSWDLCGPRLVFVKARDTWHSPNVHSPYSDSITVIVSPFSWINSPSEQLVNESVEFNGYLYGAEAYQLLWDLGLSRGWERENESNPAQTYDTEGTYNITLNVTDEQQNEYLFTKNIEIKYMISDFNGCSGKTNETLWFNDTSRLYEGYEVTNRTWDFDDGTIVYGTQNVNHTFLTPGVYNVSLTVKDQEQNCIDVSSQTFYIENDPPVVLDVTSAPIRAAPDQTVMLYADVIDSTAGIKTVTLNITLPDSSWQVITMEPSESGPYDYDYDYTYEFTDTDQVGEYFYTITVEDNAGNIVHHGGFSFTVSTLAFLPSTPYSGAQSYNTIPVDVSSTILASQHYAFTSFDSDVVIWMPMDTTTTGDNPVDVSGYENNGVRHGDAGQTESGFFGKGFLFDGMDDYLEMESSSSLAFNASQLMTWSFWVRPEYSAVNTTMGVLSKTSSMSNGSGFTFCLNTTTNNAAFVICAPDNGVLRYSDDVNLNISNASWAHLTVVYNGSSGWDVYVNGSQYGSLVFPVASNANASYLLGAGRNATGDATDLFFRGTLDDVVMFTRGLKADEIQSLFNASDCPYSHNFTGLADGTHDFTGCAGYPGGFANVTETRSILVDTQPPVISDVSNYPDTVGFGGCVQINATVVENGSGLLVVAVNVTYPDDSWRNFSMTCIGGDAYQYNFSDTWLIGLYNYSVWAVDNVGNTAHDLGHSFHVSANATISIATLQNSYSGSQYINITDPPNSPGNYTLVGRGLTWDDYYNAITGQNILEVSTGPINYQEDNSTWMPINNSLHQLATDHPAYVYGYRNGNDHGLYGVYFKSNAQNEWPVAFTYNRSDDPTIHVIRSKLVGVGYVDPQSDWAYQYLQNVQSSQGQTNGNAITYANVFTGTDVTWSYGNTELKEAITLSNATKTVLQNHPPSLYGLNDASSYLVFITKLDHQNLNMYNASGMLTGNVTISNAGVDFKDVFGHFKCALPLGTAYELNNESMQEKLTYRIVHLNGNTYLLSGLKISDLNAMTYPVVVDPTLTVFSSQSDGHIQQSNVSYGSARNATGGTVNDTGSTITIGQKKYSSTYTIWRGFVFFNTSVISENANISNATLSLYKDSDYSTTDFNIVVQNGQPTYPHNPLQSGDYNKNHYSGNGGSLNTSGFTSGYNAITLTDFDWITPGGTTKLCLRSSRDISGTVPTGNEYIVIHANYAGLRRYPPKLSIIYQNQSKIRNTGSTNIKGYLLIQVQFYNTSQGKWLLDNDTINETSPRTINSGSQLALDTIFNGNIRASNLQHGTGTYRVYTAFRDPEGNILKTNTGSELKAWWQFNKT